MISTVVSSELATPELKTATVALPAGVSVSPAAAQGLAGCEAVGPEGINIGSSQIGAGGEDLGDPEATERGAGTRGATAAGMTMASITPRLGTARGPPRLGAWKCSPPVGGWSRGIGATEWSCLSRGPQVRRCRSARVHRGERDQWRTVRALSGSRRSRGHNQAPRHRRGGPGDRSLDSDLQRKSAAALQ
jgi:hypothetical protein